MSAHRFFLERPLGSGVGAHVTLPLAPDDLHHAVDVLRLRVGERIEVVEPDGIAAWDVRLTAASRQAMAGKIVERVGPIPRPRVTLIQGVAKGEKMDAIVRQAVEVGADGVIPVLTDRSVVKLTDRKRTERGERWRRIAKAAAEQAHRFEVPPVADPALLSDVLPKLSEFDAVLVAWEDAVGAGVSEKLATLVAGPDARVAVVVGPEGGLSSEEVAALEDVGGATVSLGPTILRTDTAALVAVVRALDALEGLSS